jgi:RimJ/RimL family protein N-acetyltransferase
MQINYKTERLFLRELTAADNAFIFEFIGDRNIKTSEDADKYIQKIIANADVNYRVVILQKNDTAIGLVTCIKRNYLNHSDIGFAFLPVYNKQGYAFEATREVLNDLLKSGQHTTVLATTIPDNSFMSLLLIKKNYLTLLNSFL